MNKTERLAHDWLIKEGYTGLVFRSARTPDFLTEQGKSFEVKRLRNGTIWFSYDQFEHMLTVDNSCVLVFSYNRTPDAIISIEDLRTGNKLHDNVSILVGSPQSKPQFAMVSADDLRGADILRGSLSGADDTTQLIWIKYMAMANEAKNPDSGRLEFAKGQPYPIEYIAMVCRKSVRAVLKAEAQFRTDMNKDGITPRVLIEPDGTRVLSNWATYQRRKDGKRINPEDIKPSFTPDPISQVLQGLKAQSAAAKGVINEPQTAIDQFKERGCSVIDDATGEVIPTRFDKKEERE